jgi:hypothetical protein
MFVMKYDLPMQGISFGGHPTFCQAHLQVAIFTLPELICAPLLYDPPAELHVVPSTCLNIIIGPATAVSFW